MKTAYLETFQCYFHCRFHVLVGLLETEVERSSRLSVPWFRYCNRIIPVHAHENMSMIMLQGHQCLKRNSLIKRLVMACGKLLSSLLTNISRIAHINTAHHTGSTFSQPLGQPNHTTIHRSTKPWRPLSLGFSLASSRLSSLRIAHCTPRLLSPQKRVNVLPSSIITFT